MYFYQAEARPIYKFVKNCVQVLMQEGITLHSALFERNVEEGFLETRDKNTYTDVGDVFMVFFGFWPGISGLQTFTCR